MTLINEKINKILASKSRLKKEISLLLYRRSNLALVAGENTAALLPLSLARK